MSRSSRTSPASTVPRPGVTWPSGSGVSVEPLAELPTLQALFAQWLLRVRDAVTVHPDGPLILLPPPGFR